MTTGRKPKPTALHKLHNTLNPTRHRDRKSEPVPEGELGAAPPGMTAAEQRVWRQTIRAMPKGVLFKIDTQLLRAWCETVVRRAEIARILDQERGLLGWEEAAGHRALDRATLQLIRLAAELGFTPASRPRLRVEAPRDPDPSSPWAFLRLAPGNGSDESFSGFTEGPSRGCQVRPRGAQ
jgi:phage terminase small subunit